MPVILPSLHILTIWRIRLFIFALLPSFLSAYFFANHMAWWICTGLWVMLFCYFYIFYYPIQLKKLSYSGNEKYLLIHCGVIYTRVKGLPYSGIQYVATTSSPLERVFGLCSLVVYMAGARAYMHGLSLTQAQELRKHIEKKSCENI